MINRITILQYYIQVSYNSTQANLSSLPTSSTIFTPSLSIPSNPLLSLSSTSYTRQIWNEFYSTLSSSSSHPSSILLDSLLDALQYTYCPSGDLTPLFSILLQVAITNTSLLSRVFELAKKYVNHSQLLFIEL